MSRLNRGGRALAARRPNDRKRLSVKLNGAVARKLNSYCAHFDAPRDNVVEAALTVALADFYVVPSKSGTIVPVVADVASTAIVRPTINVPGVSPPIGEGETSVAA
jgi:hypothetical protein